MNQLSEELGSAFFQMMYQWESVEHLSALALMSCDEALLVADEGHLEVLHWGRDGVKTGQLQKAEMEESQSHLRHPLIV